MNLARVIGNVWATRKLENFEGATFLVLQPVGEDLKPAGKPLVAVDTVGAGPGEVVFYITAREALLAYKKDLDHLTPCDAAVVGIVEKVGEKNL